MIATANQRLGTGAAQCSPQNDIQVLQYPHVPLQIVLENAYDVGQALAQTLQGWTPDIVPLASGNLRRSVVQGTPDGYRAQSIYLDAAIDQLGVAGATCAVIADLAQGFYETRSDCLALHCAAFLYQDRLIAVTGPRRAGKSTLVARLTMENDMRVLCDDVLPVLADGHAMGLGIAPRLRLPLPKTCSAAFRAHVARYLGPRDYHYGYLCTHNLVPHGSRAALSIMLVLDRQTDGPARLHKVDEDEALHVLLARNMSDLQSGEGAFARVSTLLAKITCLRLVYADLEDAIALIRRAFAGSEQISNHVGPAYPQKPVLPQRFSQADLCPDLRWMRENDVTVQKRGDTGFLWRPGDRMIWHINALGLAIWSMLETPCTATEIGALLAEALPDQKPATLIADVNALFQALSKAELISPMTSHNKV